MRRRQKASIPRIVILILLLLTATVVFQFVRIQRLNKRLAGITLIHWDDQGAKIINGRDLRMPLLALSPSFINTSFSASSPFNDGKSFTELIDQFVKYGSSDMYGSPRRTGNIRRIHEGIDLYVPENTILYPLYPLGIVTEVSDDPDFVFAASGMEGRTLIDSVGVEYGKIIRIRYPEGIESLYAHLNEVYVEAGQIVGKETPVGTTGYTGNIRFSGKPSHLHIELRDIYNNSFDPQHRLHFNQTAVDWFIEKLIAENHNKGQ